jgi:predicted negative regulator of RcsB-dependent stress response
VFRINVELHPDSMNTHDSLGDAYARSGDKPKAIAAYRAGLAAFSRDRTTPASSREQLRINAEKQIGILSRE